MDFIQQSQRSGTIARFSDVMIPPSFSGSLQNTGNTGEQEKVQENRQRQEVESKTCSTGREPTKLDWKLLNLKKKKPLTWQPSRLTTISSTARYERQVSTCYVSVCDMKHLCHITFIWHTCIWTFQWFAGNPNILFCWLGCSRNLRKSSLCAVLLAQEGLRCWENSLFNDFT